MDCSAQEATSFWSAVAQARVRRLRITDIGLTSTTLATIEQAAETLHSLDIASNEMFKDEGHPNPSPNFPDRNPNLKG